MMKKLLSLILAACILNAYALAEGFTYSQQSVTDSAKTMSRYDAFYDSGEMSFLIPGLKEHFVPQGVSYLPEKNWFIFSGYSGMEYNSPILAVDAESGLLVKEVMLEYQDGSPYIGHAGGVAVTEKNIFIANSGYLWRISLEKFLSLPESSECAFEEIIPIPSRASYCSYADGILWVGEFQYSGYPTDESHYMQTEDGEHKAWMIGYELDETQDCELKESSRVGALAVPDYILTTTNRIQGMTVKDGNIYLSQSYGRKNASAMLKYASPLNEEPSDYAEVQGMQVPVWSLTSSKLEEMLTMPPASENLVTVDGAVYVLFETAASIYMVGGNRSSNPIDRLFCMTGF
ncbi:MAG: hypothetical protein IKJ65_11860 [Clostridia bacterium]|nr:hypothetical protein [Clostridia bacterium]